VSCQFQRGAAISQHLVKVSALDTKQGEIGEYASPAVLGKPLCQSVGECGLGKVVAAEARVAGSALLGEAGTVCTGAARSSKAAALS
jgi:hypothetical protein